MISYNSNLILTYDMLMVFITSKLPQRFSRKESSDAKFSSLTVLYLKRTLLIGLD